MFSGTTERLLGPNCSHSHTHELETGGKKNAKFAVVLSAADAEESQVSHSWQWCPGAQSEKEKVSRKAKMFFKDVQHHPCWTQMWTSVKRSKIVQIHVPMIKRQQVMFFFPFLMFSLFSSSAAGFHFNVARCKTM